MLRKDVILNLPGFRVKKVVNTNPLLLEVEHKWIVRCVHCQSKKLRKKDSFFRRIRHELFGLRQVVLKVKAHKFYCRDCHRYFNQRFPGILKYQRATEKLKEQVYYQHTEGISQKSLSKLVKVGSSTIERWYQYYYFRENQEILNRDCPQVLGIDEHSFSKKQGYATTFCDLRKHKVFDVVKGKSNSDLSGYLQELPGKENVKIVCMDLSTSYRKIVKDWFPNAQIVADRFHVIRLLNHSMMQTYQQVDPDIKYQRGLLNALRKNPGNLSEGQKEKRNLYFKEQPVVEAIYHFKQRLHELLMYKHRKRKQCKKLIPLFLDCIKELKQHPFEPLQTLAKTLSSWQEEIVRMWRFTKNNGITEGFHRKMKLIQRRAYGFKNFENYRLRVRVLCSG